MPASQTSVLLTTIGPLPLPSSTLSLHPLQLLLPPGSKTTPIRLVAIMPLSSSQLCPFRFLIPPLSPFTHHTLSIEHISHLDFLLMLGHTFTNVSCMQLAEPPRDRDRYNHTDISTHESSRVAICHQKARHTKTPGERAHQRQRSRRGLRAPFPSRPAVPARFGRAPQLRRPLLRRLGRLHRRTRSKRRRSRLARSASCSAGRVCLPLPPLLFHLAPLLSFFRRKPHMPFNIR